MAIIYSYPETLELLPTDLLIGTSTIRVAGKKKNITKNFTLELLKNFILDGNTGVQWGTITGILSNQTDLQAALNAKQNSITLTTTGSTGPATLVGATLNIPNYSGLSYTFTSPLVDTAGVITINQSNATTDGYLSAANWVTFNSKQNALSGTGFVKISGTTISYDNTTYYPFPTGTTSQYVRGDGSLATFPTTTTPTLNEVLTAGNASLLDAKVGELYLYDSANIAYSKIAFEDAEFNAYDYVNARIFTVSGSQSYLRFQNNTNKLATFSSTLLTNNRTYTLPDATGTLALTSDIPAPISLTTTGNSGSSTLIGGILNVPTYTLAGLGGVPTNRILTINGVAQDLSSDRTWNVGTVTSVGLSMPSAFTVSNSPITSSGTIAVTGAGLTSQYVRGDGTLATFPTSTGGGSSFNYYLNGSISQGTFGGTPYYQMSRTPIFGAGTNFTRTNGAGNGYIASFITDAGDPSQLNIPGGNWNVEFYFNASSSGGTPSFYAELYKVDVTNAFTLIASDSLNPESITNGTTVDQYFTSIPVPQTTLLITDRLAVRIFVNTGGRTITLHTENSNLSEVLTTFSTGLTALNGLTQQVQYFAVGTSGTDFNISSVLDTHTFNLPTASAANRGALSSTDWSTFNGKQNAITLTTTGSSGASTFISNTLNIPTYTLSGLGGVPYTGATTNLDLGSNDIYARWGFFNELRLFDASYSTYGEISLQGESFFIKSSPTQVLAKIEPGSLGLLGFGPGALLWEAKFTYTTLTANRVYALPNASGTIALTSDIPAPISLTTTGSSGSSTLIGSTLNIPTYTLNGLGGQPLATNLTSLSGLTFASTSFVKMTAAGTFALDTNTYLTSAVTSVAALTLGTTGADLSSTVANSTTTPVITLNVPTASAVNRGALSSTDWSTFNGKQNAITLTTTGTSGPATLVGATLNIPQYTGGGGSGTSGIHTLTKPLSGIHYTNMINTGSSSFANSANVLYLFPYIPANTYTIDQLSISVAASGGNPPTATAKVLIFSDNNGLPNTKIIESSDLNISGIGIKTYIVSQTFLAGVTYWIGYVANSSLGSTTSNSQSLVIATSTSTISYNAFSLNVTYASIPTTLTITSSNLQSIGSIPKINFRSV
jgi:hypothetical protein